MLKKLQLENYRCFAHHIVDFNKITIAVGKNNAGKSTMIEALRLISLVVTRKKLNLKSCPPWLDLPLIVKGVSPSIIGLEFSTKNVFYQYQEGPAKITAFFSNKSRIEIYIGENSQNNIELFAIIYDSKGNIKKSKTDEQFGEIPEINILPQISAVLKEENVLTNEFVTSNITTQLSSRHFRNQIKLFPLFFEKFKSLSEKTWPKLEIREFSENIRYGEQLSLIVRDDDFSAEIGWMGHGLQMWLQTMWFLSRSSDDSTVILDEPDVYMHADLQRKLIRFLKNHYKQVILATHSIEIISEVDPENILIVDKTSNKSQYASSVPAVQGLISGIGSMQNIGLARLWSAKKLLLVEGKDVDILKRLQETLFLGNCEPFDLIPRSSLGGWTGWQNVNGANLVLKNGLKQNINVYCLFDSDYHHEDEKNRRVKEAYKMGIQLHIWHKKEIENYLLSPHAIARILLQRNRTTKPISLKLISDKLDEIAEEMKTDLVDKLADEIQSQDKRLQPSTVNKKAREQVDNNWHRRFDILSGKEIINKLNFWAMKYCKASVSVNALATAIQVDEISDEMLKVIEAIESNTTFSS